MAELNVNPSDLHRVAGDYADLQTRAAAIGPLAVDEVQRIIAPHGPMGYPVALGIVTGLARRQAALDQQAVRFGKHSQRFSEHAATYTSEDQEAAQRYDVPAEILDTAAADAPYLPQPAGYIIWCTPGTLTSGFICEFMGEDGGITWRYSPIDITGGMP